MKVFLIGAGGGIGHRFAARATQNGHHVSGMHRNPEQADVVTSTGADSVIGDLINNSTEELAQLFAGHDAVVFSAGAHGTGADKTTLIDGKGLEKAADAAKIAGVNRFILVSVIPDAGRSRERNEGFEHYMAVKKAADVYLANTDLDWVIVRPGTLTDEDGNGLVTAGPVVHYGNVARGNVAEFLLSVLNQPRFSRELVEVVDGSTPSDQALAALLRG